MTQFTKRRQVSEEDKKAMTAAAVYFCGKDLRPFEVNFLSITFAEPYGLEDAFFAGRQ